MPKEEWGVKRLCPETGKRFYDLNKDPIINPYTGEVFEIEAGKSRNIKADAEDAETKKMRDADKDADADADADTDADEEVLEDEDDVDVNLGDDVLDDDDDDNVSLEEIADVPADDTDD
jgi:uncharacterized protein (TIGR02300 family)